MHNLRNMKIETCVCECLICQRNKYQACSPNRLLLPLPISDMVWEEISMDFIVRLPKSDGYDAIMVVIDRLSKYGTLFL